MKKYLIAIVVASIFSGPALAYDKALAESYEKFFSVRVSKIIDGFTPVFNHII